jgi:hypothetical protein
MCNVHFEYSYALLYVISLLRFGFLFTKDVLILVRVRMVTCARKGLLKQGLLQRNTNKPDSYKWTPYPR